jgi:hypothetical protein
LKSSIMRTHGAKEQRDTVMDTPRRNMTQVVKVNPQICSPKLVLIIDFLT